LSESGFHGLLKAVNGQMTSMSATLPAGAGGLVVPGASTSGAAAPGALPPAPPITGGGAVDAASAGMQVTVLLQQMLAIVNALIASRSAQPGAPAVSGGGGAAIPLIGGVSSSSATIVAEAASTAPRVDMRRVTGTPTPGGVIDTIIRSASPDAPPARSEGAFIEISDSSGARMQVHVHGAWLQQPERLLEGIQSGSIAPHVHVDGTVHLHDVR
jgi:hypothetical protein